MVTDLLESRLISPSLSSPPSLSLHTICISRLLFQLFRFFPSILLRTSHFLFSFPYSSFVFPLLSFLLLYFLLLFYILLFFLFLPLTPWVHSYSGLASLAAPSPSCVLTSFLPILQGLSEIKVEKIKDAASKVLPNAFITGLEAASKRSTVFHVSTGSKAVDAMLGGGIESRAWLFVSFFPRGC